MLCEAKSTESIISYISPSEYSLQLIAMTDVYGNISWWGFSPALDLQQTGLECMSKKLVCSFPDELNILLVGAGDLRHILNTISRRYRHKKRRLKFYVVETALELYARDMLLMLVALEQQRQMGLQEKTQVFLEIHGNSLVRQQTNEYIEKLAHQLIQMVTDFDYMEKKVPMFDLSQLKYKERDYLEGILKFWKNRDKVPFDIVKCWDLRMRQILGVRYDSRLNAFDWDYNMELLERGGSIIHVKQYKSWREDGIAYTIREGTYDVPNRTISSAFVFKHEGERHPRRGFWGDMVVSPYVTFGVETEEKSLYKKQNSQHTKTAEEVAEFNITSIFHELNTNTKYELPKVEPKEEKTEKETQKATLEEITEEEEQADVVNEPNDDKENDSKTTSNGNENKETDHKPSLDEKDYEWMSVDDVKVTFLPLACIADLSKKSRYQKLFNVAFFSNSMVHHLKPELSEIFADKCSVVLETALFMLHLKKDHVKEFCNKITGLAEKAGCKTLEPIDELQDSYATFSYER